MTINKDALKFEIAVGMCARCGKNHEKITFNRFFMPVEDYHENVKWTHWGTCPTNGDPILLRFEVAQN